MPVFALAGVAVLVAVGIVFKLLSSAATPTKVAAPTADAPAAAANPRRACENRILLGFQACMNEQCAKQAFSKHPVCVERRAMDKSRQETKEMGN